MTTLSKRKRSDGLPAVNSVEELQAKLRSAVTTYDSAEIAVMYLIREYKFDRTLLQEALKGPLVIPDI
jgi:hypothetical protein